MTDSLLETDNKMMSNIQTEQYTRFLRVFKSSNENNAIKYIPATLKRLLLFDNFELAWTFAFKT